MGLVKLADEQKHPADSRTMEASRRIARQARRRIELIASRLPGKGVWKRAPVEEPPEADRVVVVSDTHVGDPLDVFSSDRMVTALADTINGLGPIDELILLGDIFDFWQAPINEALDRGRGLVSAMFMLENVRKIVYIPGNHDHHLFRMYYVGEMNKRLRAGDLELPELSMPLTMECPAIEALKPQGATVPLYMIYPMYQLSVRGKEALFTHGHLLGFFERSLWRPKHSRIGSIILNKSQSLGLEDMERFIGPYYEMLALSALVPGVVSARYRIYNIITRTGKLLGLQGEDRTSTLRDTALEENAVEIEALLDHFCPDKPDYFLFGHTHVPGRLRLPLSGTTAINTGCWLSNGEKESMRNIIVEITDDARMIQVEAP